MFTPVSTLSGRRGGLPRSLRFFLDCRPADSVRLHGGERLFSGDSRASREGGVFVCYLHRAEFSREQRAGGVHQGVSGFAPGMRTGVERTLIGRESDFYFKFREEGITVRKI